ncbi:non-ribosomal peptide synthetase [Micromonospora profundi]|uniref:non-ribosomal peptide synthetase n=1 Tax=Micromonospora profundi TaxID=1420889 RepID=UPI00367AD314
MTLTYREPAGLVAAPAQVRAWLRDRLRPGDRPDVVSRRWHVTGDLDIEALQTAWRAVVNRHAALRTTLVEDGGRPVQRVTPHVGDGVSVVDLTGPARRWAGAVAAAGFDLAAGPLVRFTVGRLGDAEHLLVLVVHRAVADERSVALLVRDLSDGYAAARAGRPAAVASATDFSAYARWQHDRRDSALLGRQLAYWRSTLDPMPQPLDLPADRTRPPVPRSDGAAVGVEWDARLSRSLAALAAEAGTTTGHAVLAGFCALAGRYAATDRAAVLVPADVLPGAFDELVGPCDNPVLVCSDLSGEPSFRTLLTRTDAVVRDAMAHRDVPFDSVVAAVAGRRETHGAPLSELAFVFPAEPEPVPVLGAAAVSRRPDPEPPAAADLTLALTATEPVVSGELIYRTSLWDAGSARRIERHLRTLLSAAAEAPDAPVAGLPLESGDEIRRAVRAADNRRAGPAATRPVQEMVLRHAGAAGDAPAVIDALSYADLAGLSADIGRHLAEVPDLAGRPVAIRLPAGQRLIAAQLAVWNAGAHVVCLDLGDIGDRGRSVLADLRPACLITDGDPDADTVTHWYRTGLGGHVVNLSEPVPAVPPATAGTAMDAVAYIAYTSGSTGPPKGIAHTHRTLAEFVSWFAAAFGIRPGVRVAQWAAPGYDASLCETYATLAAGATLCPAPYRDRANPDRMARWLADQRITVLQTVPSFARELLRAVTATGEPAPLPDLRHLALAGEAFPGELAAALRAALPGVRLVNLYGPTEAILGTWHEVAGEQPVTVPIGRPIPGRQVLVLDSADRPCPTGVPGELVLRGPCVAHGYLGAAAGDRAAFRPLAGMPEAGIEPGPGYRTGDRVRRRWDGALEFLGRADQQVKFFGARLELTEIEQALAAEPTVAQCAVVAVPGPDGLGGRLVAHIVPAAGVDTAGPAVWRAVLRRRFGGAMPPVSYRIHDRLPRNAGGKLDRRTLTDAPGTA